VTISNNSGIIALYCSVEYDATQLKLTKVTNGSVLTNPMHSGSLDTKPYKLCFDMSLASENNSDNGVIATLDFEILPTATTGDKAVSITYNPDEIYDFDLENVSFDLVNGEVTVGSEAAGTQDTPPATAPGDDDKMVVVDTQYEATPWDKVTIEGDNIKDRNITTESTEEGWLIRGADLTGIKVEVQKDNKTISTAIDTDQDVVLMRENESGGLEALIDQDGDGVFETKIDQQLPLEQKTETPIPLALMIIIPTSICIAIALTATHIIKKKKNPPTPT
jgi:hypothetical protein